MITGTLTADAQGRPATASVSTLLWDLARIGVVPNPHKAADNHPDHHLEFRTPHGRAMRVGSVWSAVSERTKRPYFSLALTDRMGRAWRMNAVRGDESPKGEWRIVPLAGGFASPIALTGRLEALDDGHLAGHLGSYDFDLDFTAVANAHKAEDTHPDWHMEARSLGGVVIRVGSVWRAVSERSGCAYLSLAFQGRSAPTTAPTRCPARTPRATTRWWRSRAARRRRPSPEPLRAAAAGPSRAVPSPHSP